MPPVSTDTDRPVAAATGVSTTGSRSRRAAVTTRRRGGTFVALVTILFAVLVTSCTGAVRDPTNYGKVNAKGEGFYGNLMYGCTGVEPDADGNYVDEKLSSADYCKCLFEGLSDRVPFSDVRDFEEAQADAEEGDDVEVPDEIARVQKDCDKKFPADA